MNLEGIQTIRIMQTVFGVLLKFGVKKSPIYSGCNFSREPTTKLAKILADGQRQSISLAVLMSYHDSQVCQELF